MSELQVIRGRIVDLRRHINAHVYWRRPPGPTERYELWIWRDDRQERKFTVNTRTMPARSGHAVTVIVKRCAEPREVLGLFNASTADAVNYMRTDPKPLLRVWELTLVSVAFVAIAAWLGGAGMVFILPMALVYLLMATLSRRINRALWARRVDQALAAERPWARALRANHSPMPYQDPASRAAAQRALYGLRFVIDSLEELSAHARTQYDQRLLKWAEDSISRAKADIELLERDLAG